MELDLTFLCVDELSGHAFRDDGVGQLPQEQLQDAGHRHHVPGVAQVGVPRALERRFDALHDPRVPVYTENSLVVQSYNINKNKRVLRSRNTSSSQNLISC